MLTTNQILKTKPVFILLVNYDANIGEMIGDETGSEYLAEMVIQYHSLTDNCCIDFYVECLVSVGDNKVTIEEMNTCYDSWIVYVNNIKDLPNGSHHVWGYDLDDELHTKLVKLMESQPIYDAPEKFIIETY